MALASRIKVTTATVGTGDIVLGATGVRDATNGDSLAPAEVLVSLASRLVPYTITSGANFAYGEGLISANGLLLTRDAQEYRWNGTTFAEGLLTLAGTSTVFISPRGEDMGAGSIGASLAVRMGAFYA